jgi:hypothetical protein
MVFALGVEGSLAARSALSMRSWMRMDTQALVGSTDQVGEALQAAVCA